MSSSARLAKRAQGRSGGNIFASATALAMEHQSVNLGQGFPSFPTPQFCRERVAGALEAGHNQYTRPGGNPQLVETLARMYSPLLGRELSGMEEVTICSGAQEGISNVVTTYCDEGDEVLCIEPYFDAYEKIATLNGAKTTGVPLRLKTEGDKPATAGDFRLDLDELEKAITERTKLLVLNTPHNPTGKVFSREELEGIAKVVARHPRLLVLSDEVYEFMTFDGLPHERFATLDGMWDRTISLFSAGKTFSCTGWRIGYCIGPSELIGPLMETQGIVSFCAPTPLQVGVAEAFEEAQSNGYFAELSQTLQAKRDVLCEALREARMSPIVPQGGYFVMADTSTLPAAVASRVDAAPQRDVAVNEWLTREVGVTGIPTSYFYTASNAALSDRVLRLAYCKTDAEIEQAAARLQSIHEAA